MRDRLSPRFFLLLCTMSLFAGCDPLDGGSAPPGTLVIVAPLERDPQVVTLLVNATLNGQKVKMDERFTDGSAKFALRFQKSQRGRLTVDIDGLLKDDCKIQRGTVTTVIDGGDQYSLDVKLLPLLPKICKDTPVFNVSVTAAQGGSVVSDPPGIQCPDRCAADFAKGTNLRLYARPDAATEFIEWTGACTGSSDCTIALEKDQKVGVVLEPKHCSVANFCWDSPLPQGNALRRLFAFSRDDVFAVGDMGTILRYNGKRWTSVPSGNTADLTAICGMGPEQMVALSGIATFRFDGKAVTSFVNLPKPAVDLWCAAGNDVAAIGNAGLTLRFDGMNWLPVTPERTTNNLYALWGNTPNDLWAVGQAGAALRGNSKSWTYESTGVLKDLYGVFAMGADVFVVGQDGTVRRRRAVNDWIGIGAAGVTNRLTAIHGSGIANLWTVGTGGVALLFNGVDFRSIPTSVTQDLFDVQVAGNTTFAVGDRGVILRNEGFGWASESRIPQGFTGGRGMHALRGEDAYVVGPMGVVLRWDGTRFAALPSGTSATLNAAHAAPGGDLIVVGDRTTILRLAGGAFQVQPVGMMQNLNGVYAPSKGEAFAVGNGGLILRYDGTGWAPQDSTITYNLFAIFGTPPDNLWAVGDRGTILQYLAGKWVSSPSNVTNVLTAIWGTSPKDMWAVGHGGIILHYDGNSWSRSASGVTTNLLSLWGSAPNNIWAVGQGGTVLRWNGAIWSSVPSGTKVDLLRVSGVDKDTFWITGANGTILRYRP